VAQLARHSPTSPLPPFLFFQFFRSDFPPPAQLSCAAHQIPPAHLSFSISLSQRHLRAHPSGSSLTSHSLPPLAPPSSSMAGRTADPQRPSPSPLPHPFPSHRAQHSMRRCSLPRNTQCADAHYRHRLAPFPFRNRSTELHYLLMAATAGARPYCLRHPSPSLSALYKVP
jgi:hypothetical protein